MLTYARAAQDGPRTLLRLHGRIARDLGIAILSGRLPPGHQFETEVDASGRHKVSRAAYREAMRTLVAKGLVEARPKAGTRVTARHRWNLLDPDVLSWMFAEEPDLFLIESLFELRRIVEPEAAALAAMRRTEAHVERMRTALAAMTEFTLADPRGQQADELFHSVLLEAADNPYLRTLSSSVAAAVAWTTIYKQKEKPLARDPVPDHVRVLDAISAGDVDGARRSMGHLIELALLDTKSALRDSGRLGS